MTHVPEPEYSLPPHGMLFGKLAVVTGGASGMGRATCRVLAREGAKVVIVDVNKAGANETRGMLGNVSDHLVVQADVSKAVSVAHVFTEVRTKYQRPADILVNAAGVPTEVGILDLPVEEFDRVINTNLKGTYLMMQRAGRAMVEAKLEGGTIVNFSSITARTGNPAQSHYAATKAGLEAMSKTVAKELAQHHIRVNCVRPGVIDTPMIASVQEGMINAVTPLIPLQRIGQAHEVAEVVAFLASSRSSYMTGAVVDVDGGLNF